MAISSTFTRRTAGLGLAAAVAAGTLIAGSSAANAVTGQTFKGTVVDSAGSHAPVAGALIAVIDVDNATHAATPLTAYHAFAGSNGAWQIDGVTQPASNHSLLFTTTGVDSSLKANGYPAQPVGMATYAGTWLNITNPSTPTPFAGDFGTAQITKLVTTGGKASVSGTPRVGRTLTASSGNTTWTLPRSANGQTVWTGGFQWYAGGKAIPGAIRPTYMVGAAYAGKVITVRATATYAIKQAPLNTSYTATGAPASAGTAAKATSKTTLKVVAKKGALVITVHVSGAGLKATGKVGVGAAGKSKVVSLKKGAAKVTLKGLKKGRTKVFAGYFGAKAFTSSAALKAAKVK